nr:Clp protease N-terminal domain-containing protein [Okeania sp. SIO3B5]
MEVFELSQVEAEKLKDSKIDTEHLLLGLLRHSEARVIKVLQNLGVSPAQLQNQVFGKLKQAHLTASQPISTSANSSETNPNNAQLAMIDKILEHPEGSEAEVVKNNPGIIDPKLIGTMASMLEKRGDTKGAKVLRGLIASRTEETADRSEVPVVNVPNPVQKSTPLKEQATKSEPIEFPVSPEDFEPLSSLLEVQAMKPELMELLPPSNQDMEKFPYQLLGVSFVNKGDKQAVHNFLRENLDKLNDRFPEALQNWFHQTLPNVGDARKQEFLKRVTNISDLIRTFDGGVREINLEIALTGYNIVASILTPTQTPKDWADIQNCLGLTYLEMVQGEGAENLKQAIACFDVALNFYKKEECPELQNIRENAKKARTELRNIKE